MTTSVYIGKYRLPSRVLVAPMSGVTDLPFRRVLQRFKPGLLVSEMVAGEFLSRGDPEAVARAAGGGGDGEDINPLVIQLVGREARWMAEGARLAEAAGAAIIDINMGCPARKVTSGLSGSALMRDPDHALDLIAATVGATRVPVTLKMRLGWDDDLRNAPEIARRAEQAGVQAITVHGRTRCQFYTGTADWAAVRETKDSVNIPVFVNGDIGCGTSALQALSDSGADGVMIGRHLIGAPWKLSEIIAAVDGKPTPVPISLETAFLTIVAHYRDMLDFYGEGKGLRVARKHLSGYVEGLAGVGVQDLDSVKSQICRSCDPDEVLNLLKQLFEKAQSSRAA